MIVTLVVAAGAAWESRALSTLGEESDVAVLKRCVDVDDLLASAATGQADAAVVGLDAPGLDTSAVDHLRRHGVRPVAVVPGGVGEASRLHASRLGIATLVGEDELARLATALRADPDPTVERSLSMEQEAAQEMPTVQPGLGGRIVAVHGPAGAPGRTTIACGLAATLAARLQPVTLVDADPWGGAVAQHLGILDEVSGLLSAARLATTGQLADRFPSVQRRLSPTLSVISGLPRPDRWSEVRGGTVELLAETLQPHSHVVLDTGFTLEDDPSAEFGGRPGRNSMTLGALGVADEIVVVGSADPVGLSRLARTLVEAREVSGGQPVRVVINRNRSGLGWAERDVAGMVEGFSRILGLHFLPDDRAAADKALVAGRSLVETGDGPLVKALGEVVDAIWPQSVHTGGRRRGRRVRQRTASTSHPR